MDSNVSFGWHLLITSGSILLMIAILITFLYSMRFGLIGVFGTFCVFSLLYFIWTAISIVPENPLSMDRQVHNNQNTITHTEIYEDPDSYVQTN